VCNTPIASQMRSSWIEIPNLTSSWNLLDYLYSLREAMMHGIIIRDGMINLFQFCCE